jgi:outer membrane protein assembly factor BamB
MRAILVGSLLLSSLAASADDWPQWMGPQRDNIWREDGLLESFPPEGLKVRWRTPIAGGYAGPAVVGNRVFVTDYVTQDNVKVDNFNHQTFTGHERVLCLDEGNGRVVWRREYPVQYSISYPAGPRCTPIVHQGKVYTLGAEGNLLCLNATTGKVVWEKDLKSVYQTKSAVWGYAGHPLIDGQKLLTLAGGPGSHLVALDKDTGAEIWRAQTIKEQGYCPPTIIEAAGCRQLINYSPSAVLALNPDDGKLLWSVPYEATSGSIIMSPVRSGDYLFCGGYNNKNLLLRLAKDKPGAEVVWRDLRRAAISPVNVQPFVDNGTLYGFDQNGEMMAIAIPSGRRIWTSTAPIDGKRPASNATAFIVKQGSAKDGSRYWLFNDLGELIIAELSPAGYKELARSKPILEQTNTAFGRDVVWCMPAFANRRLYVRNDKECVCVELGK